MRLLGPKSSGSAARALNPDVVFTNNKVLENQDALSFNCGQSDRPRPTHAYFLRSSSLQVLCLCFRLQVMWIFIFLVAFAFFCFLITRLFVNFFKYEVVVNTKMIHK